MMRALVLSMAFLLILGVGSSMAVEPYVHDIEQEEDSFDGVSVNIINAEQADILAQGYEKWGIMGKQIKIEATAVNETLEPLEFKVIFTARDVFGKKLARCEKRWKAWPREELEFKCTLQVKDNREFDRITYKVVTRYPTGAQFP